MGLLSKQIIILVIDAAVSGYLIRVYDLLLVG